MTSVKKSIWKESWEDFKKALTWNNIKILISVLIPLCVYMYGYTFWLIELIHLLNHEYAHPKTHNDAIIYICIICGIILTLWFAIQILNFGFFIGKITKFFRDDKTRRVLWDDIAYFVRDMPEEERQKIAFILSPYKTKEQLRKERMKDKSWLRRTFT